jgi:hypothetical protein
MDFLVSIEDTTVNITGSGRCEQGTTVNFMRIFTNTHNVKYHHKVATRFGRLLTHSSHSCFMESVIYKTTCVHKTEDASKHTIYALYS